VPRSSADDVVAAVAREGIVVGARREAVRVGIHAFNSADDVAALISAVSQMKH
jgi:selenocysteine lyase/cysteine desulfurase